MEKVFSFFDTEQYKRYLTTMSKFHDYSFNNTLLIMFQKPEATFVAGYNSWQKNFERHVNLECPTPNGASFNKKQKGL